ncbi:hypothetical protein [Telmatospirillum sp.]|uniref:hypothetical protein n=1 Tax=Telmatospirillum sp. TaxID=2079197 RepID=UPI002844EEFA|nr:hypothetical protein [Telmatospirillum sp.]MDR3435604.1 hypothetical protein [Telmatospirillum sp.]
MKFLGSQSAFILSVIFGIFVFGAGLTSPIWFILDGMGPVEAMQAGTPIVTATIIGLCLTTILGLILYRLRRADTPAEVELPTSAADDRRKHLIVHVVTMLMFIVPFLTIILGMLLKNVIDAEP